MIDGQEIPLSCPVQRIKNRMMIPLRFIAEALGAEVIWHGDVRAATIRKEFNAEVNFTKSELNDPKNLIFDDPEPSVLLWEQNT
ncbi:MAG: copper amine oxidase N-terminal domain-containing protein [Caldisericia bacterium]